MPTTHGHAARASRSSEYEIWKSIIQRCTNKNAKAYPDYGGRGICICDSWRNSFEAFLADVGPRPSPGHSLDRENNDGNYEPGNVRWATRTEQNRNSRHNRLITIDGVTKPLCEWLDERGVKVRTFYYRVHSGRTDAEALSQRDFRNS